MRSGVTFQYVAPLYFSITYQNSLFKQVSLNEALNASADNRVLTCTCTLLFGWSALAGQREYLQTAAPGLLLLRQQRGMLEDVLSAQDPLCRQ